jgi:hypothetical protein
MNTLLTMTAQKIATSLLSSDMLDHLCWGRKMDNDGETTMFSKQDCDTLKWEYILIKGNLKVSLKWINKALF